MTLIERIESADGPDRELDAEIAVELSLPWDYAADWGGRGHDKPTAYPYTASIDTALTLAPDSDDRTAVFWQIGNDGAGGNPADFLARVLVCTDLTSREYKAVSATPALALCAAALKARGL